MGLAAARALSNLGASIVVTGRNRDRAAQVKLQNPSFDVQVVDASSPADLESFYRTQGHIDDLVLCVSGAKGAGPFRDLNMQELWDGFQQKFFAQFSAAQKALPYLPKSGSITFVTAISARAALPFTAGLAAINGALEAMVKPLARELKPLRVNAVSPGVVETPWWDRLGPEQRTEALNRSAEASLVGRNGTADELGHAIAFLVANKFVNATVLEVDGGLRLS